MVGLRKPVNGQSTLCSMANRVAATEAPPELRFACPTLQKITASQDELLRDFAVLLDNWSRPCETADGCYNIGSFAISCRSYHVCNGWQVFDVLSSGRSSAWLERLVRDQEAGGSNPLAPTCIQVHIP